MKWPDHKREKKELGLPEEQLTFLTTPEPFKTKPLDNFPITEKIQNREPISDFFYWYEVFKSPTAKKLRIDNNTTDIKILEAIQYHAAYTLDPIRKHIKSPVYIGSWYRNQQLSYALKLLNTKKYTTEQIRNMVLKIPAPFRLSYHKTGGCTDFEPIQHSISLSKIALWIIDNLPFHQIILEYFPNGWIHLASFKDKADGIILIKDENHDYVKADREYIIQLYG